MLKTIRLFIKEHMIELLAGIAIAFLSIGIPFVVLSLGADPVRYDAILWIGIALVIIGACSFLRTYQNQKSEDRINRQAAEEREQREKEREQREIERHKEFISRTGGIIPVGTTPNDESGNKGDKDATS